MKVFFRFYSLLFLCAALYLFVANFIAPCGPVRGSGLRCDFSAGKQAHIDGPAKITLSQFDEPFTYAIVNSDGVMAPQESMMFNGFAITSFSTDGPINIIMLRGRGGIITPDIEVDRLTDTYPSLTVVRTWHNPLLQLIQWYLFVPFLLMFISGIIFMRVSFSFK
jgi:hypothetical protein